MGCEGISELSLGVEGRAQDGYICPQPGGEALSVDSAFPHLLAPPGPLPPPLGHPADWTTGREPDFLAQEQGQCRKDFFPLVTGRKLGLEGCGYDL